MAVIKISTDMVHTTLLQDQNVAKPRITFNDVYKILVFYHICAWKLGYGKAGYGKLPII